MAETGSSAWQDHLQAFIAAARRDPVPFKITFYTQDEQQRQAHVEHPGLPNGMLGVPAADFRALVQMGYVVISSEEAGGTFQLTAKADSWDDHQ